MKAIRLLLALVVIASATTACTTSPTGPSHSDVTDPIAFPPH
jgi:hypothetical protein